MQFFLAHSVYIEPATHGLAMHFCQPTLSAVKEVQQPTRKEYSNLENFSQFLTPHFLSTTWHYKDIQFVHIFSDFSCPPQITMVFTRAKYGNTVIAQRTQKWRLLVKYLKFESSKLLYYIQCWPTLTRLSTNWLTLLLVYREILAAVTRRVFVLFIGYLTAFYAKWCSG